MIAHRAGGIDGLAGRFPLLGRLLLGKLGIGPFLFGGLQVGAEDGLRHALSEIFGDALLQADQLPLELFIGEIPQVFLFNRLLGFDVPLCSRGAARKQTLASSPFLTSAALQARSRVCRACRNLSG